MSGREPDTQTKEHDMTATIVTISDGTSTATIDADDVVATITPWFPEAPAEVTDAIERLERALRSGSDLGDLPDYLGVTVSAS